MQCKKCHVDIESEFLVEQSLHDEDVLEIRVICNECNQSHYAFLECMDFEVLED